jgi:ubiquinone/menaquinone biosynthesis C-methylase UbiE
VSYKYLIPHLENEWDVYWKKTDVNKEIALTQTDGLRPIFKRYLSKKDKIIEAGCGMGKWVISLTKEGYNILGVDNNKYALEKLKSAYPKAKTKLADILKLPFANNEFDAYLSLGVVEHFENGPDLALKESYRILKKGGVALVEVPYDTPVRKIVRAIEMLIKIIKSPIRIILEFFGFRKKRKTQAMKFYEYRYSIAELLGFMNKAGYKHVVILPKDDLSSNRSIALWLDFPLLQKINGKYFELNKIGAIVKSILNLISPFTYSALIVAVGKKE